MYAYNDDIKLIQFEIRLIQNLSSWLLLLLQQKEKQQAEHTHNHLVSILAFVHTYFAIRVYVELCRFEINNIIRVVEYECDEYFKL